MYFLLVLGLLVVGGGLFGYIRAKRTAATETDPSYRRAGFTGQ
jgi:hypothetical protein